MKWVYRSTRNSLYREAAQGAHAKLENVLPAEQRQEIAWAQRSLVATGMNRADMQMLTPRLEVLRQALRETRRISMVYQSGRNPAGESREVEVYGLFHRSGWWYMVGFCRLRQEIRTFRVDRILELKLLESTFTSPADFDFQAYIASDFQDIPPVRVRMRFSPEFAYLAQYAKGYWESSEDQPDGAVVVAFHAPDFTSAASNALTYGPGVIVLEPPEVRNLVCDWAQITAGLYRNEKQKE
jgi:predicted DNA-binding transcriptional regulator YafY